LASRVIYDKPSCPSFTVVNEKRFARQRRVDMLLPPWLTLTTTNEKTN